MHRGPTSVIPSYSSDTNRWAGVGSTVLIVIQFKSTLSETRMRCFTSLARVHTASLTTSARSSTFVNKIHNIVVPARRLPARIPGQPRNMASSASTASPYRMHISPDNTGSLPVKQTNEAAQKASDLLQEDLEVSGYYWRP